MKNSLKKKLSIFMLCVFALTAVFFNDTAFAEDDMVYGGIGTADTFQQFVQENVNVLVTLTDADLDYYINMNKERGSDEAVFLEEYAAVKDSIGEFKEFTDFSISEENGIVTAVQTCVFENGTYDYSFVYDSQEGSAVSSFKESGAEETSFGDKMAKAGMNTLMGLTTVFIVLIVMIFVISMFIFISPQQKKKKEEEAPEPFEAQIEKREAVSSGADDKELIAVIAAAIAAATGQRTDSFVVRSIKRR